MDVFAFREKLVAEYERFSRSFTKIRAEDIAQEVKNAYASGRFWPAPLVQINPNFDPGGYIDHLVEADILDSECAKIFRIKNADNTFGERLLLHRHQADAIEIAKRGDSYVLTTGTGSGKSLAYFIPIVDDVLRRKRAGVDCKGITAIVVYPMNAVCNSQREELERYLRLGYGEGQEPVTFARYTGQETNEERERIAKNPPDILLTNYVMLELIMTRFLETDKAIREHATGLRFLVLDELHTYRGRQGADVAMLVRRVRERFNDNLLCIGTSATMMSEGSLEDRNAAVAGIASRLFGVTVDPDNVVSETLQPVTDPDAWGNESDLRAAIEQGVPTSPTHEELAIHPVATWVELKLGLGELDGKLIRISRPRTILEASERPSPRIVVSTRRYVETTSQIFFSRRTVAVTSMARVSSLSDYTSSSAVLGMPTLPLKLPASGISPFTASSSSRETATDCSFRSRSAVNAVRSTFLFGQSSSTNRYKHSVRGICLNAPMTMKMFSSAI